MLNQEAKYVLVSCREKISQALTRERKTITKMDTLIDKESHYVRFYTKQSEWVFIKVMETTEGLQYYFFAWGLTLSKEIMNIHKKTIRIKAKLLPLVEEIDDPNTNHVSKCFRNF